MNIEGKSGLTIYDFANLTGYGIDQIYRLIQENGIDSINRDFVTEPIDNIEYDPAYAQRNPLQLTQRKPLPASDIVSVTGKSGQNLYDLAIQSGVGIDKILSFLQSNGFANINDQDAAGRVINFNVADIADQGFYVSLLKRKINIATGVTSTGFRITESGVVRLTESGEPRIVE